METALTCVTCGAPIPIAAAGKSFAVCPYCHATLHFSGKTAENDARAPAKEHAQDPRLSFNAALHERMTAGDSAYGALRIAARVYSTSEEEEEAMARATLAIAYDFDQENHTRAGKDVTALQRIAGAYIKARGELASADSTEINLPFLCAADDGPKHCQRVINASDLDELSHRAPSMFDPPAQKPAIAVAEPEPPKKKKWWPFG